MTEAKHTPGPWELRASAKSVDYGIIVNHPDAPDGWAVIGEAFTEITKKGEHHEQALPNARVMAAGPDMLEALRAARAEIGYFRRHAPHVLPVGHELVAVDTLARIDAAIAKATGSAA